jgi:hypothetical protein
MSPTMWCPECKWRQDHVQGVCVVCRPVEERAKSEPEPLAMPLSMWPTTPPTNGVRTSDEAAASLTPDVLNDQQRTVLRAIWRARYAGIHDEGIQAVTGLSGNAERPRRGELLEAGWIEARRQSDGSPLTSKAELEAAGKDVQASATRANRNAVVWFPSGRCVRAVEAKRGSEVAA